MTILLKFRPKYDDIHKISLASRGLPENFMNFSSTSPELSVSLGESGSSGESNFRKFFAIFEAKFVILEQIL